MTAIKHKLIGCRVKIFTKKGFFFHGEIVDEDLTHIFLDDYKKGNVIMFAREWISELIIEDDGEGRNGPQ